MVERAIINKNVDSLNQWVWPVIAKITTKNTQYYIDTNLTADQTYYYRVRAFNSKGYSQIGGSGNDYAITATKAPNTPSNLKLLKINTINASSYVDLSWNDNSLNEEGFILERSNNNIDFVRINDNYFNFPNYKNTVKKAEIDRGLQFNTIYYYRVKAYNKMGHSGYSNIIEVKIP